jgi:hypothetical protein
MIVSKSGQAPSNRYGGCQEGATNQRRKVNVKGYLTVDRAAVNPSHASTKAKANANQLGHKGMGVSFSTTCHPDNARTSCNSAIMANTTAASRE